MADQIRTGQVIDRVVGLCRALPGFRAPEDDEPTPDTTVWDGPEWQQSEDHAPGAHLIIGWSGDRGSPTPAAESNWIAGPIARDVRPRDETTQLACLAVVDRQDTPKDARDAVLAVVSAVAGACREDPSLGIDMSQTIGGVRMITYLTGGSLTQWLDKGFTAQQEFTLTYKTRV